MPIICEPDPIGLSALCKEKSANWPQCVKLLKNGPETLLYETWSVIKPPVPIIREADPGGLGACPKKTQPEYSILTKVYP